VYLSGWIGQMAEVFSWKRKKAPDRVPLGTGCEKKTYLYIINYSPIGVRLSNLVKSVPPIFELDSTFLLCVQLHIALERDGGLIMACAVIEQSGCDVPRQWSERTGMHTEVEHCWSWPS